MGKRWEGRRGRERKEGREVGRGGGWIRGERREKRREGGGREGKRSSERRKEDEELSEGMINTLIMLPFLNRKHWGKVLVRENFCCKGGKNRNQK